MNNESFLTIKQVSQPQDAKGAIQLLGDMVRKTNDPDLLLRAGAINGTYSVYERTHDAALLEQVLLDIVLLMRDVTGNGFSVPSHGIGNFTFPKNDLIYAVSTAKPETELVEDLIKGFVGTKEKASTRKIYTSALKTLCFDGLDQGEVAMNELNEFADRIEEQLRRHPEYNHNVRGAANGFIKYLRKLQQIKD